MSGFVISLEDSLILLPEAYWEYGWSRKPAGMLDLERNQAAVRALSEAVLEYGYKAVRKVCRKVGRLRRDNSRRTVDYALGILVPMSLSPTKAPESEKYFSY